MVWKILSVGEREFFLEGQIHGRKKKLTMENLMDNEGGEFYIGLSLLVRTEGNLIGNLIGNWFNSNGIDRNQMERAKPESTKLYYTEIWQNRLKSNRIDWNLI